MTDSASYFRTEVPPSGPGCVECEQTDSWWFHLRRCAYCGHVGCCDDSLNRHATAHAHTSGHRVIQSYEPGEEWFWDYGTDDFTDGPALLAPTSHRRSQSTPGPSDRVPRHWQRILENRPEQ